MVAVAEYYCLDASVSRRSLCTGFLRPGFITTMQPTKPIRQLTHRREKVTCQPADSASGGSCSLGQDGASAKEVSHKAEATIPGSAASIHADGMMSSNRLAGRTTHQRLNSTLDRGRAESRRLLRMGLRLQTRVPHRCRS